MTALEEEGDRTYLPDDLYDLLPGDVVQLGDAGGYTHAALIVDVRQGECYVAAHTLDSWMRPLSSYRQPARRFLHILGVRGRG